MYADEGRGTLTAFSFDACAAVFQELHHKCHQNDCLPNALMIFSGRHLWSNMLEFLVAQGPAVTNYNAVRDLRTCLTDFSKADLDLRVLSSMSAMPCLTKQTFVMVNGTKYSFVAEPTYHDAKAFLMALPYDMPLLVKAVNKSGGDSHAFVMWRTETTPGAGAVLHLLDLTEEMIVKGYKRVYAILNREYAELTAHQHVIQTESKLAENQ